MRVSAHGCQHSGQQLSTDAKFPAPCLPVTWEESLQAMAGKTLKDYKDDGMELIRERDLKTIQLLWSGLLGFDIAIAGYGGYMWLQSGGPSFGSGMFAVAGANAIWLAIVLVTFRKYNRQASTT